MVDSAGSSGRKVTHQGKDYDYVFDVDIQDGVPPLKLPFNVGQIPYDAATKFINDNELPINYLDQVANFIITNTQPRSILRLQARIHGAPRIATVQARLELPRLQETLAHDPCLRHNISP